MTMSPSAPILYLNAAMLITGSFLFPVSTAMAQDVVYTPHEVRIRVRGGEIPIILGKLDTPEAATIIRGVCAGFGCSAAAPAIIEGIRQARRSLPNNAEYWSTGVLDPKSGGNQWWVQLRAPAGYLACDAQIVPNTIAKNKGGSFSGAIFRNPATGENWIGVYADLPRDQGRGHWAFISVVLKSVRPGTEGANSCKPNATAVWNCGPRSPHGDHCRQLY
jgi:hypothetical protein